MSNDTRQKRVVVIGGGTGTYTALMGLKKYPAHLSAVVSMADDGGSNKVIRDEFGLLPTSDIRQCFVALAEDNGETEKLFRDLFMYRFHKGNNGIKGMTFGNLFLAALSDILGSQAEAIKKTSKILKLKGQVLPVTLDDSRLAAVYENGQKVTGEHLIDEPRHDGTLRIKEIMLEPASKANPEAVEAIKQADLVVLGPGDLYTSLIPNLLVDGISKALCASRGKIAYVLNLMTKYGQTHNLCATDHVNIMERHIGRKCLDAVIVNNDPIPDFILKQYRREKSFPVADDLQTKKPRVIRAGILGDMEVKKVKGDRLKRSLVRHDSEKLAQVLLSLL
ncbi:MAG: YvcK family protein [Candidatus Wildermuthbacteria bacterium]|nr:YvcK family protein [Candidatus Wildermuthbacteria bacterium]